MDLATVLNFAEPYIVEGIFALILTFGGARVNRFFSTKQSQESLHKALHTGVGLALDTLESNTVTGPALERVVAYVYGSVPDSIKYLGASKEQVRLMAESKLREAALNLW